MVYENEQFLSIVTLNTKYTTKRNHAILLNSPATEQRLAATHIRRNTTSGDTRLSTESGNSQTYLPPATDNLVSPWDTSSDGNCDLAESTRLLSESDSNVDNSSTSDSSPPRRGTFRTMDHTTSPNKPASRQRAERPTVTTVSTTRTVSMTVTGNRL